MTMLRSLVSAFIFLILPPGVVLSEVSSPPPKGERVRAYLARSDFPARVDSVVVSADAIHISGHAPPPPKGSALFLAEIRPHEDVTLSLSQRLPRAFPIQPDLDSGEFDLQRPRIVPVYDQIQSKWAVIARPTQSQNAPDTLLSHAVYPTNLEAAALRPELSPQVAKTRKGLGGIHPEPRLFPDLLDLGIGHLTHNIVLSSLLRQHPGPDTIPHEYTGRTYHFSKQGTEVIDRVTTFAHENGIIVSAIILIPNVKKRDSWTGRILTHPDCDPSGKFSMANVATFEGGNHYAATMRFLAERYTRPDAAHGRIAHWIIHNEVDSGWVWTNAGAKSPHAYLDDYVKSMRIAYHAVRSYDPHARVFISLTHHWTSKHKPNDPRFYPSRQLLTLLNRYAAVEGNFEWGLAFHPYPQNLFQPRTWEDKAARNDFDTPFITFKNIEVLDRWMRNPVWRYRGKPRMILLSEQGFHAAPNSPNGEKNQAAALAYAWRKISRLETIEAFHYHRWIDHEKEGGLNLGLWTVKPGTITLPDEKRLSWRVFQKLDTPQEEAATDFAKAIVGAEEWDKLSPNPSD